MHYAQLAIAFQDATPVDDADELAQNVLWELKKLQDVMLTNQEHVQKLEYELNTGRSRKCAAINEIVTTNTSHNNSAIVVEEGETHIVQLLDKLNPQLETHLITVPCVKRNDGIVNYVCEFCSKEFRKKYNLIRHRRTHSHDAPYKCEHCSKCCITKSKLEQHRKLHNKQSHQYICSICKQHLSSIRDLDMHTLKLHYNSHELHYLCLKCSHSFTSLGAFAAHKHQQQDKEYQKLLNLLPSPIITNLYSNTTGINKSDTKCATCDCLFSTKLNLKLHYKIYASHKRYNCGQCKGKSFQTAARLRRHMFTHSNIGNYKCVYCIKTYKTKKHCALHIRKHLNDILDTGEVTPDNTSSLELIRNKEYLVVIWEKEQTAQNPLISNTKSNEPQVHPNHRACKARRQNSNKCGSSLLPLTNVSLELDNFNSDRSCMYCKCIFKKPSDLQRHLCKHTKERPFVCEVCGKSFALKATLKEHQLTHIRERRETFDCQVCGKSFSSKKSLVLHLRIHTGIRPFLCQNCRQAFRTSGHFKAHIKTAHK